MANKKESKARSIINEILEKVKAGRDDKKVSDNLWIDESVYGRDNQAAVGLPGIYDDDEGRELIIEPNAEGTNISLVRYVNGDLHGGVNVKTVDEAFNQIAYFAIHGVLKNENYY